jgi:HAE1 family hydrophobic/amphiphilic exporter-1
MTFAPLNLMSVSLNIMSLGGLALGIGMLVDSSIVVLESIFRCREEGDDIRQSAIRGSLEVRGAVIASTLTSIAVFFPMVFVEGIAGQAFGDLGLAVVVSLMASLFVAILFIPMLASRKKPELGQIQATGPQWKRFQSWENFKRSKSTLPGKFFIPLLPYFILRLVLGTAFDMIGKFFLLMIVAFTWFFTRIVYGPVAGASGVILKYPLRLAGRLLDWMGEIYPTVIRWALANPLPILLLIGVTGFVTWKTAATLDSELLPEVHQGEFTFEVSLPVGTPLEETVRVLEKVEQAIVADKTDINALLVTYGYDVTNVKRSDEGEHTARFKVLIAENRDQEATEQRLLKRLRPLFQDLPDVDVQVVRPVLFSSKTPIVVEVHGEDLNKLKEMSQQCADLMRGLPELADVETSLKSGAPEIQIQYNRDQIMRYGMNINGVATQIRNMVKGAEASRFNLKDRRIPIVVRLEEPDREHITDIGQLTINGGAWPPIELSAVADLTIGEGPSEIRRVDGKRVGLVRANLGNASLGSAVEAINSLLQKKVDWPSDMTFFITGQNEEWENSKGSLFLALGLSIFLVYVIMAAQFESLTQPFIIMFTVPLAFFGTIIGLKLLGISLSIVVFLGMIMLVGIVVNNAIVLIDYTNTLRGRGIDREEAIVTAGKVRLRPILITTATTVLGLVPMAIGLGDGSEIRTPMAIAVIFGLVTSTVLTLIVIPTVYSLVESFFEKLFGPNPATPKDLAPAS